MTARRRDYVVEEVERLLGTDSPEHIAARLGYSHQDNLARVLNRAGRHDLARRFWLPGSTRRKAAA